MSQTPIVVLDETDRLLDMGFRREITKILKFFPRGEQRQTLLFSATIPPDCKCGDLYATGDYLDAATNTHLRSDYFFDTMSHQ